MAPVLFLADDKEAVYEVVPLLVQISAVKVATTLWNRADIRYMIERKNWREAEAKVRHYVQFLLLTEQAKVIVLNFTEIICDEIHAWMKCYGNFTLPKHLYWTAFGSLDITKTALSSVNDPALDLSYRYELACTFCFESNVMELWNQLPDCHEGDSCISNATFVLTTIWTHAMKTRGTLQNSFEKLWSDTNFRFNMELPRYYTKTAAEYFLPKLSHPVRAEFLARVVRFCIWHIFAGSLQRPQNDLVFFLLSQTDTDQQISCLKINSYLVLTHCLAWPWQTVFMPVAKLLEPFLLDSLCVRVFDRITDKFSQCAEVYNYQQLFTEFWKLSPVSRKRYVMQQLASFSDLLYKLFTVGDRDNITLILQDATTEEQEKIVSYYREYCDALEFDSFLNKERDDRMKRLFLEYLFKEVRKQSC